MAKKKVNVELNMTPFIGLFALLVVMLLLTAVWNNISALSTNTSASTASDEASPPPKNQVNLTVTILTKGVEMAENTKGNVIPHLSGEVNKASFITALQVWRSKYPKRKDLVLNTENGVTYKMLITVFDTLVGEGWHDVGVSTQ
ncbi:MAG: hypothetical protein HOO06_05425 [Bdellovibrionaceae bacterium]|jgi:biopolymer transport protein ExbD|nr:hypothetical protein [Pseudobdellovibrionaceae bacterium]